MIIKLLGHIQDDVIPIAKEVQMEIHLQITWFQELRGLVELLCWELNNVDGDREVVDLAGVSLYGQEELLVSNIGRVDIELLFQPIKLDCFVEVGTVDFEFVVVVDQLRYLPVYYATGAVNVQKTLVAVFTHCLDVELTRELKILKIESIRFIWVVVDQLSTTHFNLDLKLANNVSFGCSFKVHKLTSRFPRL